MIRALFFALPAVDWSANFNVAAYNTAGMDYAIIMGYDYYYSGSSTPGEDGASTLTWWPRAM